MGVILFTCCLLSVGICFGQTGNDIITAWTGTVDQVNLKVRNVPANGKVIQLVSATTVSAYASFRVINTMGLTVPLQAGITNNLAIEVHAQNGNTKLYTIEISADTIPAELVTDITATVTSIRNKILHINGRSAFHVTQAVNPLEGSFITLDSEDIWLYFDNIKPSVFNVKYLDHLSINGRKPVIDSTVRLVQYLQGCVLISQSVSYQPLEIFTGENLTGSEQKLGVYAYLNAGELGAFNNAIASFRLKKGYMVTFAENELGTGQSKVYVAAESDIIVNQMPGMLNRKISFVRIFPWRWVVKKGWTDGIILADTLNCSWNYNWNNNKESTPDAEYVPIRQTQYWPGLPNNKKNVTALLGFNEPNSSDQANMTPDQAVAAWPELMESGLRLGSPAVTDGGQSWLYSFMDKCNAAGYRVDFIAIHWYKGCQTAAQFYSFLKEIHDRTQLPIWITEFNNGANWTTSSGCPLPTYTQQATKIGEFIQMLDTASFVERYAIYEWVEPNRYMFYSINPIVLNPAGVVYRNQISPMAFKQIDYSYIPALMTYTSSNTVQVTAPAVQNAVKIPVLRLEVHTTGSLNPLVTTEFLMSTIGTSSSADITNAKIYYTGTSPVFATGKLFGKLNSPSGYFTISGKQTLEEGTNYFWLTYDLSCGTDITHVLDGQFILGTLGSPVEQAPAGWVTITPAGPEFSTIADGDWSSKSTWACGLVPSLGTQAVKINNNVNITGAVLAGNITIAADDTLSITASGILQMGTSSTGTANGNSNKKLTAYGTLSITGGTINVNGSLHITPTGGFTMTGGTVNIDGNDGTMAGSIADQPLLFLQSPEMHITGGNINILDPSYSTDANNPLSQRAMSYDNPADVVMGTGCTLTIGGGDDINATALKGFYINTGAGTTGSLEVGTMVINGGRIAQRKVTTNTNVNYITKVRNMTINNGAELVINGGPVLVTGNLVNNGVVTSTSTSQGQWLVLAGGSKFGSPVSNAVNYTPSGLTQSVSGTGFFKHTVAAPDPTAQSGNLFSGITIYHTSASPGVTLQLPLTLLNVRLMGGKINTSSVMPLALGCGTSLPGNPGVLTPTTGMLYQFVNTSQSSGTLPVNTADYNGGWVNGPFSRWVTATITAGQQGLLPTGTDSARPGQIIFTTAPATPGYITGQWFDANPGNNGLPLTENSLSPFTVSNVVNGYWQIKNAPALTGGIYRAVFTNRAINGMPDFSKLALLKRTDALSGWILDGTHLPASGNNGAITVERAGLSGLGEFAIGTGNNTLPISLEYLKGRKLNSGNLITWKVNAGAPTITMELEKSQDAGNFKTITGVVATAERCLQPFSYTDFQSFGSDAYYKLKIIDADGRISYSPVVTLLNASRATGLVRLYPTLVSNKTFLNITASRNTEITWVITDMYGRTNQSATGAIVKGSNVLTVDASRLAAGNYCITVYNGADRIGNTLRFIVNR